MAQIIVILNEKELKANPITDKGWDLLGTYLKAKLLNELKLIDDKKLRSEMRDEIQSRDYTVNDVIACRRQDVFNKMLWTVFEGNAGITEDNVFDLLKDENWLGVWQKIMEASGIVYKESEDNGNPPAPAPDEIGNQAESA